MSKLAVFQQRVQANLKQMAEGGSYAPVPGEPFRWLEPPQFSPEYLRFREVFPDGVPMRDEDLTGEVQEGDSPQRGGIRGDDPRLSFRKKAASEKLQKIWDRMNDSERFGVQFGMFPAWVDEDQESLSREEIVELMGMASGQSKPASRKIQGPITSSRKTAGGKWYVHVNAVRPDGTKDSFYTKSFSTQAEAEEFQNLVLGEDRSYVSFPGTYWEAEIQGPVTSSRRKMAARSLYEIAEDISQEWGANVNYAARPYLDAMMSLDSITDMYGLDSASSVVAYFLSNASSFRGDRAKELKAELKDILSGKSAAHVGPGPQSDAERCPTCWGKGWIDLGSGLDFAPVDNTCPTCKGTGIGSGVTQEPLGNVPSGGIPRQADARGPHSELIYTDSYGEIPRGLWYLLRRSNVSPADFTDLVDTFGNDFDAITKAVKDRTEEGMYRGPWPPGNFVSLKEGRVPLSEGEDLRAYQIASNIDPDVLRGMAAEAEFGRLGDARIYWRALDYQTQWLISVSRRKQALDPQSGHGDSSLPTVEEDTPDNEEMWPWEIEELETGGHGKHETGEDELLDTIKRRESSRGLSVWANNGMNAQGAYGPWASPNDPRIDKSLAPMEDEIEDPEDVEVSDDDETMWPWVADELSEKKGVTLDPDRDPDQIEVMDAPESLDDYDELPGDSEDPEVGQDAADVAAVPTPGDALADQGYYPQPDSVTEDIASTYASLKIAEVIGKCVECGHEHIYYEATSGQGIEVGAYVPCGEFSRIPECPCMGQEGLPTRTAASWKTAQPESWSEIQYQEEHGVLPGGGHVTMTPDEFDEWYGDDPDAVEDYLDEVEIINDEGTDLYEQESSYYSNLRAVGEWYDELEDKDEEGNEDDESGSKSSADGSESGDNSDQSESGEEEASEDSAEAEPVESEESAPEGVSEVSEESADEDDEEKEARLRFRERVQAGLAEARMER